MASDPRSSPGRQPSRFGRRPRLAALALLVLFLLILIRGLEGTKRTALHTPKHVCRQAQKAAAALVGSATLRIADSDPANIECLLSAQPLRVDVVAQASPRAWEEFDTVVVHQAQAFAGASSTPQRDLPQDVAGLGYNAAWIPSKKEFVATNGTQSTGGSFLTVTITPRSPNAPSGLKVAKAVATATLAVAPKGPSPGPAPS